MYKLTIILPVINETSSLLKTIRLIEKNNYKKTIKNILIVMSKKKTLFKSKKVCIKLSKTNKKIKYFYQKKPFLGGAMQEAFKKIKTSHCIMMSSDLETNPNSLQKMIKISYKNKNSIITASRWEKKGAFKNYGTTKVILNYIFQKMFSILYNTNLNDLTFGYRLFPTKILKKIIWEMEDHSFLFETIIKALKVRTNIIQISSDWVNREEGESNNNIFNYFKYCYIGLKVFFKKKDYFLN